MFGMIGIRDRVQGFPVSVNATALLPARHRLSEPGRLVLLRVCSSPSRRRKSR